MLYHFLFPLADQHILFNVFQYISFRAAGAMVTALLTAFIIGPGVIRKLRKHGIGQIVRAEGPATHLVKAGTPTMGGIIILTACLLPTLLWARLDNTYVWVALVVTAWMGAIGFMDDYLKIVRRHSRGLIARYKLIWQFVLGLALGGFLLWQPLSSYGATQTMLPFFKDLTVVIEVAIFPLFVAIVVAGSANTVNLTDGLDGLAIGATLVAAATYAIFVYIAGNSIAAGYLQVSYVPGAGEVAIICSALVGASLGFLWFNAHPAQVFMGDVGSLAIGGTIGAVAVLSKQELLLVLVGGLFVLEALSVIVQVASFKMTGRRVLRMAPLHHHFELRGWSENQVIVRFWILAVLFAFLGLSTLKLR